MTETKYSSFGRDFNYIKWKRDKEENEETERQPRVRRGLMTLAAVGVGMYVIGRITGIKDGYRIGFDKGIIHTVNNFAEGVEVITKQYKESKGS